MDETKLKQFVENYAQAWRVGTVDALMPFWDPYRFRFYKAEEVEHVHREWADVLSYWRMNEGMIGKAALVFDDLHVAPLDAGWATAVVKMRWSLRFTPGAPAGLGGKVMGGYNHVTALFYEDRLAGWIEAPDAPLIYLGRLYEGQASGV